MSKTPLEECLEERSAIGKMWLDLVELIRRTYREGFIAKNHQEPDTILRHMTQQHSHALIRYDRLSQLTGFTLCPECRGEKNVTQYGEYTVTNIPCPVCQQQGIVKCDSMTE